ncbi:MAG: prepilin-type N-terminal cleavage/methylation domain-containing protein [Verrucomicrobiota bacterium]
MRTPFKKRTQPTTTGFTLVELLVAMSVLVLLLVLVSQLVNSASLVTSQSGKRLDADTQARMLFDCMAVDFENMIKRPDVDTLFYKATGNDKLFFFSQAPAYFNSAINATAKSDVALVGYRVTGQNGDASNFAPAHSLERLGKGLTWDGTPGGAAPGSMVFASGSANPTNTLASIWTADIGSAPDYSGSSDFYHVLADQVFRMEICFQVKDVTHPNAIGAAYSNYPVAVNSALASASCGAGVPPNSGQPGSRWYDTVNSRAYLCASGSGATAIWQANGLKDLVSIVVTIAVLDHTSRAVTPDLASLAALFADADEQTDLRANPPKLPAQKWKEALETAIKNSATGIPKEATAQIRIYQRHFQP